MTLQDVLSEFSSELEEQNLRPKRTRRFSKKFKKSLSQAVIDGATVEEAASATDLPPSTIQLWRSAFHKRTKSATSKSFNSIKIVDVPSKSKKAVHLTIEAPCVV